MKNGRWTEKATMGRPVGKDGPRSHVVNVRMTGKELALTRKLVEYRGFKELGISQLIRELIEADIRRMEMPPLGWKKYLTSHGTINARAPGLKEGK